MRPGAWLCAAILLLGWPSAAAAQIQSSRGAFVAIPDTFPDIAARAVIVREPGLDVVLLRPTDTSSETLAMALSALRSARQRAANPRSGQLVPVVDFVITNPPSPVFQAYLDAVVDRLLAAPRDQIGPLGLGRWVRLERR